MKESSFEFLSLSTTYLLTYSQVAELDNVLLLKISNCKSAIVLSSREIDISNQEISKYLGLVKNAFFPNR